jgi:hypothetical protein
VFGEPLERERTERPSVVDVGIDVDLVIGRDVEPGFEGLLDVGVDRCGIDAAENVGPEFE